MKNALVIFIIFLASSAFAQKIYMRNDSIPITQDSITFISGPHRGNIQWQKSFDKLNWTNITNKTSDSIIVKPDVAAFYRAKITEGTCLPIYSDTAQIAFALPEVTTSVSLQVTDNSAFLGGNVINNGGSQVFERGVVCTINRYSTAYYNTRNKMGNGNGIFNGIVSGLTENTTYYVYAYAINSEGISIGNEVSFRTSLVLPTVNTLKVSSISETNATLGGDVTHDGGAIITARGVCWSTNPNPTIEDSKTSDCTGSGSFTSNITGLVANTTYYARAYAISSVGTVYGNEESFTTRKAGEPELILDSDGNIYHTVIIGKQIWMVENLKTTTFNDGSSMPNVTESEAWRLSQSAQYCWYNNDESNKTDYGALYNWYAVNTGNLAPAGWHVPSDSEWITLINYLGGDSIAGGKLKESGFSHWLSPNTKGTNESGFTALPGGYRGNGGYGNSFGYNGYYWSSSEGPSSLDWFCSFSSYDGRAGRHYDYPFNGYSVRCLKDTISTCSVIPSVITTAATEIRTTQVFCGGNVISDGGSELIDEGGCWNTTGNPTVDDKLYSTGIDYNNGIGGYGFYPYGLEPNTTYYVRAYAKNSVGTAYGNEVSFRTGDKVSLPTVTTNAITNITQTSANSGGNVTFNGYGEITARGICWSTSENPTIANDKSSDWFGIGSYDSYLTGLNDNTTYFVRAYATNSSGTGYGNQVSFTTSVANATGNVTDIDGNVYHTITIGTQVWMVENLKTTKYNDGTNIPNVTDKSEWANLSTPGYCWYNNDESNKNAYGALYNWYAVNTGKLCPKGWHVPTDEEWTILITFIGGQGYCGSLIEPGTSHWQYNPTSNNETGFTALPGGSRFGGPSFGGEFNMLGSYGNYWTSSSCGDICGSSRYFSYYYILQWSSPLGEGLSVRCLKDY